MKYHILTLFPEMIEQGLHTSILGRAINNGYISLETTNIRDFSANKFNRVDDYPYGGGAGMVMEAEPVFRAYQSVAEKIGKKPRTVYLTPQGKVLNQTMVEELALEDDLVLLCGHYEGIDDRVLQEVVTDYISIELCFNRRRTRCNGAGGCGIAVCAGCLKQRGIFAV